MAVPHAGRFAREGLRIPKQLRLSWYMGFFNIPWLSDWVVSRKEYVPVHSSVVGRLESRLATGTRLCWMT